MTDRLPPYDEAIERATLGGCFQGGADDLFAKKPLPDWFYTPCHRQVFEKIAELHDLGAPINPVSVLAQLERSSNADKTQWRVLLNELADACPSSASMDYFTDQLVELWQKRRIIQLAAGLVDQAFENERKSGDLLEEAGATLSSLAHQNASDVAEIPEVIREVVDDLQEAYNNQGRLRGLSTGFHSLDCYCRGLKPGQLVLLGGRTSSGKTSLALNIAENVAIDQGTPVLMFSLEMTKKELVTRMLCSRSGMNSEAIESGCVTNEESARIGIATAKLSGSKMLIVDKSDIGVAYARAVARREKQRRNIGLIVIDYVQLMSGRGKFENRTLEVSQISRGLKGLAKELNLPILALAQLSRAHVEQERPPELNDLRESGSLEQDADGVWLLERKPEQDAAKLHIRKNRSGRCGTVQLSFNGEFTRFSDLNPF